jgi:hypothetical protein
MKIPTKFPTVIGLFLLLAIIGTIMFVERMVRAPSDASGSQEPTSIHFTNVSDTSFAVSWVTQVPASGTLLVSAPGKSNQIYYDERDQTGKLGKYTTHMVAIRDARPSVDYTIKVMSNGSAYENSGKPYTLRTPEALPANTNGLEPAYGTIKRMDDQPAEGALVYLTLEGGQELSVLTKPSGLWLIPLNQVRTADLTSFLPTLERMGESIVVHFDGEETTAMTDTLNDSPVPEMTPGKIYDFRRQQAKTTGNAPLALRPLPVSTTAPTNTLPVGAAVLGQAATHTFPVTLTAPAEGSAIPSTLPLIQGTGFPDKFVGLTIGITQPISGSVKVAQNGVWSFTPPKPIPPGKQSVTISTVDSAGKPVAITHSFTILKSGTQVLGDATPSATLTDTPSPTPNEVPVPTSTLSGVPPPKSGNELPTILLLLLGIGLFAGGAVAVIR